jgi:hypothetical protein
MKRGPRLNAGRRFADKIVPPVEAAKLAMDYKSAAFCQPLKR